MPEYRALLIGASEYDDHRIQDLPFVVGDLRRVQDTLLDRGFKSAEIVESKRGITPNTVHGHIRRFLREAGADDTLFVLLSGHGQHFEGRDYLIPEDATFDMEPFADSCVEIGWEKELEQTRAGRVVFLIDACREGIDRDSMAAPGVQPWSKRKIADALRRKVAYVYACSASQLALFVRASDTLRPGYDAEALGTEPGESFSLFSRAVADVIAAEPHALGLYPFFELVQSRVDVLHHAYGKARSPQRLAIVMDTDVAGDRGFPVLPGPDRHSQDHPWLKSVAKHPVWDRVPDSPAVKTLQQVCCAVASRLVAAYEQAADSLSDDPWHDAEFAQRALDRMGFLVSRLASEAELSPTEAALAVLSPLAEQTFWVWHMEQSMAGLEEDSVHSDAARLVAYSRRFPRLRRRLRALRDASDSGDSAGLIGWWLHHRWLIQQPELYTAEPLESLLADASDADLPPWISQALSARRFLQILHDHRTAPFAVRPMAPLSPEHDSTPGEDHDTIAASTADEHVVRDALVHVLVKAAYAMAVDPLDLPEIVVEHVGIYDSVDIPELLTTVRRSEWRASGMGRSLSAVCAHPAVQIALRAHAGRVDALLRDINRSGHAALAPLGTLPMYADGSRVRLDGSTPDELADGIRFQLAEDRVQELLMGEQLYGDRNLAVRELYQNALDAVRYRDCRTQYLRRTGRPVDDWEGRIAFFQGVDADGRPYLECRDTGIGMGITELSSVFSQGGARFVDLPEYIEEQAAWQDLPGPPLRLHPNSRFGIGVLSYFMLADEIVVRTCRLTRDGRPGRLLQVTIAGPGNLFRVEDLGDGEASGTTVRLLLTRARDRGSNAFSCVEALRQVLWVAPYHTSATHGSQRLEWQPGQLSYAAYESSLSDVPSRLRSSQAPLPSNDPDLWWIDREGILLADGLYAGFTADTSGARPYGVLVNLHGEHAPELSVDRKGLISYDIAHLTARVTAAVGSLSEHGHALSFSTWLTGASDWSVRFGDRVAEHARESGLPWRVGAESVPYNQVGFFPPDTALVPLLTGDYPEEYQSRAASYLCTMPVPVLRWRLRTLYRAGLGGTVSLSEPEAVDSLHARPSDVPLLAQTWSKASTWGEGFKRWLEGPSPTITYSDAPPSPALANTGVISLKALFPWKNPEKQVEARKVFALSDELDLPPAEIADRLALLGYRTEPLPGAGEARPGDVYLLDAMPTWPAPGATLSSADVAVAAARANWSTSDAADRLRELGFAVPVDPPLREHWTWEERDAVMRTCRFLSESEDGPARLGVSAAVLVEVAHAIDLSVHGVSELLGELGFTLPSADGMPPELTDDDRELLTHLDYDREPGQEASLLYLTAVARRVNRPVREIADRLRELGYDVAAVPDEDELPTDDEIALLDDWLGAADKNRPLGPMAVADIARREELTLLEAGDLLASWGYASPLSPSVVREFTREDSGSLYFDGADPEDFGQVSPDALFAVALHTGNQLKLDKVADSLTGLGFDVAWPSGCRPLEQRLEWSLIQALRAPTGTAPVMTAFDGREISLTGLAVAALFARTTLREAARKAAELGLRHEAETWFSETSPEGAAGASAAATPPLSAAAPPPGC